MSVSTIAVSTDWLTFSTSPFCASCRALVMVTPLMSTGGPATFLLVSPARMPVLVVSMVPLEMTRSPPVQVAGVPL